MISNITPGTAERAVAPRRPHPVSTYRLQFNRSFGFRDAAALVPYLNDLGVTDCYASPYLKARPGSLHGYDIVDHNSLNPEIGSEEDYAGFVRQLQAHGMGQILDFVPNHMGIIDNPWWTNVLENGPASPYAQFFDIDWRPVKAELREKVLLPILGDLYGKALEEGQLRLSFDQGAFFVTYGPYRLPVGPRTTTLILNTCVSTVQNSLSSENPDFMELQSIITAASKLPERGKTDPESVAERTREKEIIKRRLRELCQRDIEVERAVLESVVALNGAPGDASSFDRLHELLEAQAYRLSYWRVAAEEINYRRFFDVNELAGLRMETPLVFEESHRFVRRLLQEGMVTGLRIDHVDGLFDPEGYLARVQASYLADTSGAIQGEDSDSSLAANGPEHRLRTESHTEESQGPASPSATPLYIVVEKVLGSEESLRETWPVHGTTGYEFGRLLNGIFVDSRNATAMLGVYDWFTGADIDFHTIVHECKDLVMRVSMSAELNVLAHELNSISERNRWYRDYTLESLRDAAREIIACFPVYRSYINAADDRVDDRDRTVIEAAVSEAQRRNPAISASIFEFIRDTLLLRYPADKSAEGKEQQRAFVMRFQQLTGPVMAKGMEDTAFYIYNPLVSLNEVGGHPDRFGNTVREFHSQNILRRREAPHGMVSTYTHDSKRSEDVRARINVLSEIPREWRSSLGVWNRLNRDKRLTVNGQAVPDRNDEYLLYQTLLGTYPIEEVDEARRAEYVQRIQNYMLKAIREAKVHTSWINPNIAYEQAMREFIAAILEPASSGPFLADFAALNQRVAYWGMFNSLSQTLLKLLSPGVPDTYQGSELWDFSLVDPDNRRPVDFDRRRSLLDEPRSSPADGSPLAELTQNLMKTIEDGRIKLYVTWKALTYRRDNARLFEEGDYVPLQAPGPNIRHVCAFGWQRSGRQLIVVAPRLIAGLTQKSAVPPTGPVVWGDSLLELPDGFKGSRYRNVFTGEWVRAKQKERGRALPLSDVLATFPVAALEAVSK